MSACLPGSGRGGGKRLLSKSLLVFVRSCGRVSDWRPHRSAAPAALRRRGSAAEEFGRKRNGPRALGTHRDRLSRQTEAKPCVLQKSAGVELTMRIAVPFGDIALWRIKGSSALMWPVRARRERRCQLNDDPPVLHRSGPRFRPARFVRCRGAATALVWAGQERVGAEIRYRGRPKPGILLGGPKRTG